MKKLLSIILAVLMIATTVPFAFAADIAVPDTVYFDNTSSAWSTVNAYFFDGSYQSVYNNWPGTQMAEVGDNIYSIEVPEGALYVVFNDSVNQTADLTIPTDGANCYDYGTEQWVTVDFSEKSNTVILYTNDIHCNADDYAILAAYRAELISQGNNVITVDAGDAFTGNNGSCMLKGGSVVEIMNAVGYDYAVPGEGEFGYGVKYFFDLADNEAEFTYTSSNLYYLPGVRPMLEPYSIKEVDGMKIAFIGISTPESVAMLPNDCFKDENSNYIYGFPTWDMGQGDLSGVVQESVDKAIAEGADLVVAIGHLGIEGTTEGWKSIDVIAETTGIDYFIDAHSHEVIESKAYTNKDGENVILTSGGEDFSYFGQITLNADGSVAFELIDPDIVDIDCFTEAAESEYNSVKALVDKLCIDDAASEAETVIEAIDEALESVTISEIMEAELEDIKAELDTLKADPDKSKSEILNAIASLIERAEAIAEIMTNCAKGVHRFTEYEEVTAPECDKAGLEKAVCDNGCGEADEQEIPALSHKDDDGDYKCDYGCGHEFEKPAEPDTPDEPTDSDCDHLCHKTGFVGLIWKIFNFFFFRLFNIQQYCDCGVLHYGAPVFG